MEDLQQFLVANNLYHPSGTLQRLWKDFLSTIYPAHGRTSRRPKLKQVAPDNTEVESRSNSRTIISDKRKVPLGRVPSGVDFRETLNAKCSRDEGDLLAKLRARTTLAAKAKYQPNLTQRLPSSNSHHSSRGTKPRSQSRSREWILWKSLVYQIHPIRRKV